jgi:hypothetical protein
MGRLEFVLIGFDGSCSGAEVAAELNVLRRSGVVRLLDLLYISKDSDGNVSSWETSDLGDATRGPRSASDRSWFQEDDVLEVAEGLHYNSSAAFVVFEHTWSRRLRGAIIRSGGEVLISEPVPNKVLGGTMRSAIA